MNFFKKFKANKAVFALLGAALIFNTPYTAKAEDLSSHWAKSTIDDFVSRGVLQGYDDGSIRPDNPVTRAEMFAFTNRHLGYQMTDNAAVNFPDVKPSDWFYNDVAIAVSKGYVFGDDAGTMRPNSNITRQEAATIIARIISAEDNIEAASAFSDFNEMADYAKGPIGSLAAAKIVNGYDDGTFHPRANITRAESMTMLKNMNEGVQNIGDQNIGGQNLGDQNAGTLDEDKVVVSEGQVFDGADSEAKVVKNLTVAGKDAVVRNVSIEGDLVIAEAVANGSVTLENVKVDGNTYIYGGGANSIHAKDSELNNVTINSKSYSTRLVLEGRSTTAEVSYLTSGALEVKDTAKVMGDIVLKEGMPKNAAVTLMGVFDKVVMEAPDVKLAFPSGTKVSTLTVESSATGSKIDVGTGATIQNVGAHAKVSFAGQGTISSIDISVTGVTMEKTADSFANDSETPTIVSAPSSGGGGGGGGGGQSAAISVTGVSVSNTITTKQNTQVGDTLKATPTYNGGIGIITYQWYAAGSSVQNSSTDTKLGTSPTQAIDSTLISRYVYCVVTASGTTSGGSHTSKSIGPIAGAEEVYKEYDNYTVTLSYIPGIDDLTFVVVAVDADASSVTVRGETAVRQGTTNLWRCTLWGKLTTSDIIVDVIN